ncbi:MAG: 50S ribosomal protein L30 [Candidatus Bathyarchaeia archaeon]
MENGRRCLIAVRVRGTCNVSREVEDTLNSLCLLRPNHAVIIDDRASYIGMLKKVQNQITWGEISYENLLNLIKKWGRVSGGRKITDEYAQKTGHSSLEDLAEAIFKCEVEYKSLPDVKPVFRLHPPRKGFKGKIKKSFQMGGALGYRGEAINELLKRMI